MRSWSDWGFHTNKLPQVPLQASYVVQELHSSTRPQRTLVGWPGEGDGPVSEPWSITCKR